MPTADQLRLAEILDRAGFAYLEVSGGGCFDAAVQRGVESPWERIRALQARVKTPLGMALRGRFLVGARPVGADFARRFVASAAENGIDVFRLHDPLNDVSNLREAAEAIVAAERDFEAGLVYSPGRTGEIDTLIERARMLPELGAVRVLLHDPTGSLQPIGRRSSCRRWPRRAACRSASTCRAPGSALAATLAAAGAGAQLIACAVFPSRALHRVSGEALGEALRRHGPQHRHRRRHPLGGVGFVDEHIGDEPVAPLAPRTPFAPHSTTFPPGSLQASTPRCASRARRPPRGGCSRSSISFAPSRLAAARGADRQVLASQALLNVLSASRYLTIVDELRALVIGRFGQPPGPIDPAVQRAVALTHDPETQEDVAPALSQVREQAEGMAASEEELLLLGLFGEDAERLLLGIRGRASGETDELASVDKARAERIRELVRIVQESGIGEVTIEEDGMKVSVRSARRRRRALAGAAGSARRRARGERDRG